MTQFVIFSYNREHMEFNYKLIFGVFLIPNLCYGEIKQITTLIRHTERNPFSADAVGRFYPNDPHINEKWEPDGPEQLNMV